LRKKLKKRREERKKEREEGEKKMDLKVKVIKLNL
jgi:hypothetical protein